MEKEKAVGLIQEELQAAADELLPAFIAAYEPDERAGVKRLVEKAIRIVEENIADSEFSVEELASRLNLSRSYFYKKLMKITGKKPIEFIRTIRMKRACQLLTESQLQVSEIAYMLGYNSPRIFSRHFKEEFGVSPSEYLRRQQTAGATPNASA